MNTTVVVIDLERFELPLQVETIPEEHVIEILATNCADETFHKRMRNRHMRNRLVVDFEHAQVGKPAMKTKQWIMVGTDLLWYRLVSNGVIEHSTHGHAVNLGTFDSEADDAARKHVQDHHHPKGTQED